MSDFDITKFKLDLDTGDFVEKADAANEKISELHSDIHKIKIAEMFEGLEAGVELAEKAFEALKEALEVVFDQFLDAEKLNVINYQFEQLSKNAGLSADHLKEEFEKAAKGMVPLSEILEVANKALINMGAAGSSLPQLFELAQNQARAFGKTALESFESITRAVEFGNQRELRRLGIKVDLKKAEEDYARSVGFTGDKLVENLTEEEKIRARVLALQKFEEEKMVKTPENLRPVTDAWAKFKASLVELKEVVAALVERSFGPFFKMLVQGFEKVTEWTTRILKMYGQWVDRVEGVKKATQETEEVEKKIDVDRQARHRASAQNHQKALDEQSKGNKIFHDEALRLDRELAAAENKDVSTKAGIEKAQAARELLIRKELAQELRKINAEEKTSTEQKAQLRIKAEETSNAKIIASDKKAAEEKKKIAAKEFDYKTAAQKAFSSNYMQSMKDLGSGTKDASEAMKSFFLSAIGDMATARGEMMVAEAASYYPNFGQMAASVAGGGALIALGAALGGMAGGSAGSTAFAASGGYASEAYPQPVTSVDSASSSDTSAAAPAAQKSVTIHVAGNYFETEETRRHLTEIIRKYQDATNFTFAPIGSTS